MVEGNLVPRFPEDSGYKIGWKEDPGLKVDRLNGVLSASSFFTQIVSSQYLNKTIKCLLPQSKRSDHSKWPKLCQNPRRPQGSDNVLPT